MQVRLKELEDNRKQLGQNIEIMNGKINEFNAFTCYSMQQQQIRLKAEKAEQKRLAEEAKLLAGRRGQRQQQETNSPMKSTLKKTAAGRSGSVKGSSSRA